MPDQNHDKPVLMTLPRAAKEIGIEYRQLLTAVDAGLVPHYRLQNSYRLVSVREVLSAMQFQTKEKDND